MANIKNRKSWQIAFCPWIQFETEPFELFNIQVTGFQQIETGLSKIKRAALWRAAKPYSEHFLGHRKKLRNGNANPLAYIVDKSDPLRPYTDAEIKRIHLANTYLYICSFSQNTMQLPPYGGYTSWSDWSLYFHNIRDTRWYALQPRRLYGHILSGGHQWSHTIFSRPAETNNFRLIKVRKDLIAAINDLYKAQKAEQYFHSMRTFAEGTTDRESWLREDDLPFIKDAIEQISKPLNGNPKYHKATCDAASKTRLKGKSYTNFIRAVSGRAPENVMICNIPFNPHNDGTEHDATKQQKNGVPFSWLERALDDLNVSRNMIVHDGFMDEAKLKWPAISLAFIGSRFFVCAFKRMLEWEIDFKFDENDEHDLFALGYLAKHSRRLLTQGVYAYQRVFAYCDHVKRSNLFLKLWEEYEASSGKSS